MPLSHVLNNTTCYLPSSHRQIIKNTEFIDPSLRDIFLLHLTNPEKLLILTKIYIHDVNRVHTLFWFHNFKILQIFSELFPHFFRTVSSILGTVCPFFQNHFPVFYGSFPHFQYHFSIFRTVSHFFGIVPPFHLCIIRFLRQIRCRRINDFFQDIPGVNFVFSNFRRRV